MTTADSGPRLSTLVRLAATGGRTDTLRIALTVLGAAATTLVLLLAAAVASIRPSDGPYSLQVLIQPGLRPGVIVVLLLICVPLIAFVGQCTRIGAPGRDRRLAALRMAGGTPSDVLRIVALESGVAAVGGALLGTLGYLTLHVFTKSATFPTDVTLRAPLFVLTVALVPIAATLGSLVALRHVTISPFGVVHAQTHRPPTVIPAILFLIGGVGLAAWDQVRRLLHLGENSLGFTSTVALLLFVLAGAGLILGSASSAYGLGRLLVHRTSSPALLIAARRMIAAPFTASRASTAVVLAVLLGAAVQSARSTYLLLASPLDHFFADTFALLNIVLMIAIGIAVAGLLVITIEGVITRRRTLASLVAAGTPRWTLASATLLETLLPLVPTVTFATITGLFAARGFFGTTSSIAVGPTDQGGNYPHFRDVTAAIPWVDLAILAGGTLAAAALMTAAALPLLRRSTSISELRAAA